MANAGWLDTLTAWVDAASGWVWGVPLIGAIFVTGILLTFMLRFTHVFSLKRAFKYMFHFEKGTGARS